MRQFKYRDLEHYREAQTEANKRKLHNVWVREDTVAQIVALSPTNTSSVLCHGTRNGAEQQLFRKYLTGAYVIGTEISDTATQFKHTVQHDFHERKPEWVGRFCIVYSNSFDHSHNPLLALQVWREQLAPGGRLFLEHGIGPRVNVCSETDPLEIEREELLPLLRQAGLVLVREFRAAGIKGGAEHESIVYVAEKA